MLSCRVDIGVPANPYITTTLPLQTPTPPQYHLGQCLHRLCTVPISPLQTPTLTSTPPLHHPYIDSAAPYLILHQTYITQNHPYTTPTPPQHHPYTTPAASSVHYHPPPPPTTLQSSTPPPPGFPGMSIPWYPADKNLRGAGVRQCKGRAPGGASSPVPATDLPTKPAQVCLHHGASWPQVPQLLTAPPGYTLLPVSPTSCCPLPFVVLVSAWFVPLTAVVLQLCSRYVAPMAQTYINGN